MKTSARYFSFALAAVSALLSTAPSQQTGAEQLFRSSQGQGIRVSIELKRGSVIRRVSPQTTFLTGDRVKIHFSTNFDGYVYALNEAPSGDMMLLFPTRQTGTSNLVLSGRDYVIPATNGWFRFDSETGAETIHMIGSRQALPELEKEQQLKAQSRPQAAPLVQPAENQAVAAAPPSAATSTQSPSLAPSSQPATSAVQKNVASAENQVGNVTKQAQKAQSGIAGVQKDVGKVQNGISLTKTVTSMPQQMLGIFGVRRRDLTFEDDPGEGAAYVASAGKLSDQPVYFIVELVHQ